MLWIRERSCISLLFKLLRMEHGVVLQGIAIEVLHLLVSQHSLVDDVSYWPTLPSKLLTLLLPRLFAALARLGPLRGIWSLLEGVKTSVR